MAMLYRVRDWEAHFENSRSRTYKRLDWVPIPNKHDGKGFRRLIAGEHGPALFAAWVLIVQVASKCPERGVLADEDGPLDADDLCLKTGCPAIVFEQAFEVLSSSKIGWLEVEQLPDDCQPPVSTLTDAVSTLSDAVSFVTLNRTEEKRTEEKRITDAADADGVIPTPSKPRSKTQAAQPIEWPAELDRPDFRAAWEQWREHRRQIKKPLTALAESKALQELATKGLDRALAAINHSIANGWQGIFEPKSSPERGVNTEDDPRGNFAAGRRYLEMFGGGDHE